jgi:hypothetical protein
LTGGLAVRKLAVLIPFIVAACAGSPSIPVTGTARTSPPETSTGIPADNGGASSEPVTSPSYPPDDPRNLLNGDIFSAPGDPIVLTATEATDLSASADVGPDGGTVTATGSDGTQYMLTVPAGAVAMPVTVTMTPIANVSGFPDEVAHAHTLGVVFEPEGLELAQTATLTMQPTSPPDPETYAFEYEGKSAASGFHPFDVNGSAITMPIDHFSTYEADFPIAHMRYPMMLHWVAATHRTIAEELRAEIAVLINLERQKQLVGHGEDTQIDLKDLARSVLPLYKRTVIRQAVSVADQSCANANDAMLAYIEYQKQRQELGVGDDPSFDLGDVGTIVPRDLMDLTVQVCFKEAYDRCVKTGDFPSLAAFVFSRLSIFERTFGQNSPEWIQLGQSYLKRCGTWRVLAETTMVENDPAADVFDHHEARREFTVQWKPGSGEYGIVESTISGSGPVETTVLDRSASCKSTVTNITSSKDADATIAKMGFEQYEGPLRPGEIIQPLPTILSLILNFGEVSYHFGCLPYGAQYDFVEQFRYNDGLAQDSDFASVIIAKQVPTATFNSHWTITTQPYVAITEQDTTFSPVDGDSYQLHNLITVSHEPT